jgi:hypothetical protein
MARTFIRQDTQIRTSDVYDDTVAPTEAAFETNPVHIETDLNNVRSMLSHLLDVQAGNWYDVINTPSTLETGTQRGISNLNTDLHALEKKRVLRRVKLLTDITVPAGVAATGVLSYAANVSNGDQITTGSKTYTYETALTNVDGNVLIGASASDSLDNLIAAINLGAGSGSLYAAATTANGFISGAAGAGDTMDATALIQGTQGNTIVTTDPTDGGGVITWTSGATLTGGTGDLVILGAGELPSQTTAAVGAVTTLGTVVAFDATFGTASLVEVAGAHALAPKNLVEIVDGNTGDPVLSTEGKRIWGLLQSETATDPHTITDTTTTRVQITFVHGNATNDDLIFADGLDIGNKTVNYCYPERIRLEDLTEGDFLSTAAIDIGAGAVTPTRQLSYDNQGVTPVELTTNADLDLAAGIEWSIRDLADADLFRIIEGSGGGTTEINIHSGVDLYDNDAIDVDFASGASINSGGTRPIDVGVNDGIIESTAGDLGITGAAEILFDDVNQSGSTWVQTTGIKLSETTAEWDAFSVEYGEVSLLNAIVQASNTGGIVKTCANVIVTTNADTDVSLSDSNLDAALGDLSTGDFVGDHDIYLNGALLRSGIDAAANNDVYPGTDLNNTADGQLKFEFTIKINDVICVINRA